jgi:hypothetical protein
VKGLTRGQILAGVVIAAAAGAIAAGLFAVGSPSAERARRLDQRRVDHLEYIGSMIDLYWTRHGRLPSSLEELSRESGVDIATEDPVTNRKYEYRPSTGRFELCAVFEHASDQSSPHRGAFWSHAAGRQCFEREVQKVR